MQYIMWTGDRKSLYTVARTSWFWILGDNGQLFYNKYSSQPSIEVLSKPENQIGYKSSYIWMHYSLHKNYVI